MSRLFRKL